MPLSPVIIQIESWITLILQLNVSICFGIILYWKRSNKKKKSYSLDFTSALAFYICSQVVYSILCLPHIIFLISFWREDITVYNSYWMAFTGCLHILAMQGNTVAVFFLGVERCLYVTLPFKAKNYSTLLSRITFITILIIISFIGITELTQVIPQSSTTTNCANFGCMLSPTNAQIYTLSRITLSALNMSVGIILIFLVKTKIISKKAVWKTTRLVLFTIFMDFLIVLIPHATSFILLTIWNFSVTKTIGSYSLMVSTLNSSFCGFIYVRIMKKTLTSSSSVGSPSNLQSNTWIV